MNLKIFVSDFNKISTAFPKILKTHSISQFFFKMIFIQKYKYGILLLIVMKMFTRAGDTLICF